MDLNVQFSGNLSAEQRAAIVDFEDHVMRGPAHFGKATTSRLELSEVDVYERPEDGKTQARVVFEIDMAEGALELVLLTTDDRAHKLLIDMLNARAVMHGGCVMHLIDV